MSAPLTAAAVYWDILSAVALLVVVSFVIGGVVVLAFNAICDWSERRRDRHR